MAPGGSTVNQVAASSNIFFPAMVMQPHTTLSHSARLGAAGGKALNGNILSERFLRSPVLYCDLRRAALLIKKSG